ncbi:DUF3810 domain-containing protein [Flavisolibacter ginsenosidimutans]|uniref:DUF3810 domain-containing protein n=1 Tax=Flavisolibacter ginsenosidimutans TaxID=661481 RepID=A0A5B8UJC8_9BACT|nr:DUF3810 domain-containing protein [Flavisolibacter ginsenosidimutans]QEC56249.1 DUF3810 domain-containing protein [Flavisolibacter ginsenosidimutans]
MFKALFRDRFLLLLVFLAVLLKLFSFNAAWVERYYTFGLYPGLSKTLRWLFGWIPFSLGDLAYIAAFIWLVLKVWKLLRLLKHRQAKAYLSWMLLRKYLKLALLVYLVFSLFWGLNYYRQGIAKQLGISLQPYSVQDLFDLTTVLQQRLNDYAVKIDSVQRLRYNEKKVLFAKGEEAYRNTEHSLPFLIYSRPSIKPSLFTPVGHWFGFTGYYNPFSGEAQIKTDIPVFLKPFVVTHEMAHQLGYAKENEANFVAYLTCKNSGDPNFLYSAYFEMYRDAIFECTMTSNKELTEALRKNILPRVKWDVRDLRLYLLQSRNFIEPLMSGAYDKYLKLNNQPQGSATYNEVIAYLIGYMKKFGGAAI